MLLLAGVALGNQPLRAGEGVVRMGNPAGGYCPAGSSHLGWQCGVPAPPPGFDHWVYVRRALHGFVYPVRPTYHDPRDGRLFSAQGYGMPVAAPLAAPVEYQYNYSQGHQSSRLTPIFRVGR